MKASVIIFLMCFITFNSFSNDIFGLMWEPKVLFDKQLFPSYAWANSTRNASEDPEKGKSESERIIKGDREGQLGVSFTNFNFTAYSIEIQIECPEIMEKSTYKTHASDKLPKFSVFPEIAYKYDVLRNNKEPKPISVKFSVFVDGKFIGSKNQNLILRSRNDCPYTFVDADNKILDLNYMYATYVNENNPRISNEILPNMLKKGIISSVSGYQSNSDEVYKQVFAVWDYFNSLGIKYSSLNSPLQKINNEERPFIRYQFVRTFDESINSKQANCVDGTVAMASVLYKMGIQPIIITTPNHCFLGFYINQQQTEIGFIETTLLGNTLNSDEKQLVKEQLIYKNDHLESNFSESFLKFNASLLIGRQNFIENHELFNAYNPGVRLDLILQNKSHEIIDRVQYRFFTVDSYRRTGLLSIY